MKLKNLVIATFIILSFGSCVKDTIQPVVENPSLNANISFASQIQPEFTSKCTSCHGGSIAPDLRETYSYSALFANGQIDTVTPANSTLYTKIKTGGSMESYTNQAFANKVLNWIDQGAKNN